MNTLFSNCAQVIIVAEQSKLTLTGFVEGSWRFLINMNAEMFKSLCCPYKKIFQLEADNNIANIFRESKDVTSIILSEHNESTSIHNFLSIETIENGTKIKYTFVYDLLNEFDIELNANVNLFKNSWSVPSTTLDKWVKIIDKNYEDIRFNHGVNVLNIKCINDGSDANDEINIYAYKSEFDTYNIEEQKIFSLVSFAKSTNYPFSVHFEPKEGTLTRLSILSYKVLCISEYQNIFDFKALLSTRKFNPSNPDYRQTMEQISQMENRPNIIRENGNLIFVRDDSF
ncbi:9542_t:CDS:2 [Diversispora eburnea]|uniref:9542_t:CDS:1 n=1 Tax=Diversispora eburnea TaxID=1213867 RepID=A0A9N9BMC1_9GLOM|nr:9542_t:CDS:2 [Diversispora eburnea]